MQSTLLLLALAGYLAATCGFLYHILFRGRRAAVFAWYAAILGFVVHSVLLVTTLVRNGYPFILAERDSWQIVSWTIMILFFVLRRRLEFVGSILIPIAITFFVFSIFESESYRFLKATSPWIFIHLMFAFLAFALFLTSFVVGVLFIIQEHQIKSKHLGRLVPRLPALEVLDGIHYKALVVGLVLLTFVIVAGSALNLDLFGVLFTGDPKQIWVLVTWLVYVVLLNVRIGAGWRGRRGILLSVLGFIIVVLVFFGLQHGAPHE